MIEIERGENGISELDGEMVEGRSHGGQGTIPFVREVAFSEGLLVRHLLVLPVLIRCEVRPEQEGQWDSDG